MNSKDGSKLLADITPIAVDTSIDWNDVGGLDSHIRSLKEMVILPLLYPEFFEKFGVQAPRGVLFYGPPGTGKTLTARALAACCSSTGKKVSFFMRKGADVLNKWVGESERQLRLLFEEATRLQPSVIFFDEIDGLAPVRSSRQDHIHSSIVSTMLALMDGLTSRFVISHSPGQMFNLFAGDKSLLLGPPTALTLLIQHYVVLEDLIES